MENKPFAWLVPHCPDFYFMPSIFYHKVFAEWDDETWDCPAYWASRGIPVIPCYKTEDVNEAECWICKDKYGKWSKKSQVHLKSFNRYGHWIEALDASKSFYDTYMLKLDFHSPINRGRITGDPPTFNYGKPIQ